MNETLIFLLDQIKSVIQFHPVILKGLGMTIVVSLIGIVVGGIVGFALGVGRASTYKALSFLIGAYTDIFRGTPVLVQLFVVYFILPQAGVELDSFTAGAIALSNISACFVSEIVASGIRAIPVGQLEAAAASGLSG
jgi:polar amino acid transport system permease protein